MEPYRTAVSLHSHTNYSHEKLQFIPAFTERWPVLHRRLERVCRRSPIPVDFSRAYWTPPLTPRMALNLEKEQIERTLGRSSLVSLTDHDSIHAPALLRTASECADVPLSLEWSVPYAGSEFHLGVHNLPARDAVEIVRGLEAYTRNPCDEETTGLLAALADHPDVLIVFNHPFWDLTGIGPKLHLANLTRFLRQNRNHLHALELNGLRKLDENRKVKPLAEQWQLPLVSGGDRHASEPSATLNLSNAATFAEFVHEIRDEQRSHVLFMAQYAEPMFARVLRSVLDVIREYPEYPAGSRRWDDRVFYPDPAGEKDLPLSAFWTAPPRFIERIFACFHLASHAAVEWTLKQVYAEPLDRQLLSDDPFEALP